MLIPEKPLLTCRRGNKHPPHPPPDTFSVSPTPRVRPPSPALPLHVPRVRVSPYPAFPVRPALMSLPHLLSGAPPAFPALFPAHRPAIMRKFPSFPHPPAPNLPGIRKKFPRPLTVHAGTLKIRRKSQGGVQVPTGGEPFGAARGRVFKGKAQIRCKSGADGNSPEERERIFRLSPLKHSPLS